MSATNTSNVCDQLPMSDALWRLPDAPDGSATWNVQLAQRPWSYVVMAHQFSDGTPYMLIVFQPLLEDDPVALGIDALESIADEDEIVRATRRIVRTAYRRAKRPAHSGK